MTKVAKRLYDDGFQITGEGRRIDVIDSENKKHLEIFFFPNEILIMSPYDCIWVDDIASIGMYGGLPQVQVIC